MPCLSWLVNARNRGVRGSGPPGFRRGLDATDRAFLRGAAGVGRVHDATNARCRLGLTWHTPPRCIARHGSQISPGLAPHAPVLPGRPRGVDTTIATRSARRVV
jgi:hypothetical protein